MTDEPSRVDPFMVDLIRRNDEMRKTLSATRWALAGGLVGLVLVVVPFQDAGLSPWTVLWVPFGMIASGALARMVDR